MKGYEDETIYEHSIRIANESTTPFQQELQEGECQSEGVSHHVP